MKTIPTKEQVLDALATHKTVWKASVALGVKYPTMQKYIKMYGIKAIAATCITNGKPFLINIK